MATISLENLHVATLTSDESGITPVYEAPVYVGKSVSANITSNENVSSFYAEGEFAAEDTVFQGVDVEINIADLTNEMQQLLLGHTKNTDGVTEQKIGDEAPWVALGFSAKKANGEVRYIWLYKGKFRLPSASYSAKTDSSEYQTNAISSRFVQRESDKKVKGTVDSDVVGDPLITAMVLDEWFDYVYGTAPIV